MWAAYRNEVAYVSVECTLHMVHTIWQMITIWDSNGKFFADIQKMKVQSFSEKNRKIACVEHDKIKD